jgi:hypothetical protein
MHFPPVADARRLSGHPLVDEDGEIVGPIVAFYADAAGGVLEWAEVQTGIVFGRRHLVPLGDAMVGDRMIEVGYAKSHVLRAPTVGAGDDAEPHLSPTEERALYDHYGLPWEDEPEGEGHTPEQPPGAVRLAVHPPSLLERLAWG